MGMPTGARSIDRRTGRCSFEVLRPGCGVVAIPVRPIDRMPVKQVAKLVETDEPIGSHPRGEDRFDR